jgi:transposase
LRRSARPLQGNYVCLRLALSRRRRAQGYLPPYSPDLNPIEKAFSKLKALLRKLAERTVAGLIAALEGSATTLFKSKECANYFEACGYDPAELLELNST